MATYQVFNTGDCHGILSPGAIVSLGVLGFTFYGFRVLELGTAPFVHRCSLGKEPFLPVFWDSHPGGP